MTTLKIGDTMRVKGPKGAMVYTPNMVRRFGMIAGGTGITPMLQVVRAIVRGRERDGDKTEVDLLFANVNQEDILLRDELEQIAASDKGIRVHHVLNNPPEGWTGGVGFVTADMIKVRLLSRVVLFVQPRTLGNGWLTCVARCRTNFPPRQRTLRFSSAARRPWSAP